MGEALQKNQGRLSTSNVVWFVARGNVLKGPFSQIEIEDRIKRRELGYFDFCWKQGFHEWRPIASVEDFERRTRMSRIPVYPEVALPGGSSSEVNRLSSGIAPVLPPKKVLIGFARSRRHSITAYEWAAAMIFSVVLAYFASVFALNQVKNELNRRWHLANLGRMETYGSVAHPVPSEFWSPLYSAPSFVETAQISNNEGQPLVDLNVSRVGSVAVDAATSVSAISGVRLDVPQGFGVWNPRTEPQPDAYGSYVQVQGRLSAKDGGLIHVMDPAYPSRWEP